jgi:hypothetical protein
MTLLEAARAAQGALKDGRHTNIAVELLREILDNLNVLGAARALSCDQGSLPPTLRLVPNDGRHAVTNSS